MKVIIIGAGLSGITLANSLSDTCDVTILEKGPENSYKIPENIGFETKLASVPTFCFGNGGTTNLWHNGLIPLDYSSIEDPTLRSILLRSKHFLDDAARVLGYTESEAITGLSGCFLSDSIESKPLYYPNEYGCIKLNSNVRTYFDIQSFEIVGSYLLLSGVKLPFDKLIFCSGGLSTSILLNKHFNLSHDGHFIDHPMGFVGKIKIKKKFLDDFSNVHEFRMDKGSIKSALLIKLHGRTSAFYLRPAGSMSNSLAVNKYKSLLGASSGFSRFKKIFNINFFKKDILAEIFNKLFRVRIFPDTYSVMMVCDQKIRSNILSENKAELIVDPSDLAIFKEQLKDLELKLAPFCESINFEKNFDDNWLWSAAHHSGSLPAEKFVDENLQLKDHKNIYICDASILSEHQFANTGLTLGSLALYLSDRLKNENCNSGC
ncbi:GMC oxidoreductase [Vibrio cyclitrophicus]|uniref:GMC oxidoreductase n=1 Tax=Vibrio cyclitrophicus TaxID=47951 RepID=UPI000C82DC71|nr:GMC oxidoreductase [Vibrio cyclitrophicus]PMG86517.1 hypothetical protein BCU82_13140 [Vibrio cyclitrophicus]